MSLNNSNNGYGYISAVYTEDAIEGNSVASMHTVNVKSGRLTFR